MEGFPHRSTLGRVLSPPRRHYFYAGALTSVFSDDLDVPWYLSWARFHEFQISICKSTFVIWNSKILKFPFFDFFDFSIFENRFLKCK